jgi:glucose-6-phosphate 1-dehydrogenase
MGAIRAPVLVDPAQTPRAEFLCTRSFEAAQPYERILEDAIHGDRAHFAREDYVEEAWRIVDGILKAPPPVEEYEPGSWGPPDLDRKVAPPGGWQNPTVDGGSPIRADHG